MQSCTINGAAIFVPKPTLQSNNVLCGCLSPPMPSLPLPPDDDDGFLDLVPAVVPKAKVIARSRGKSGEGGKQKPVVLPPDDDEADSLFIPTASAPSTMKACRGRGRGRGRGGAPKVPVVKDIPNKIAKAKGKPNPKEPLNTPGIGSDYLPWHDERLKDSALQFESVVDMPYLDLHSLFYGRHPSPVSEDDRCDLWEIYSIPRLGPCIRELGGKSRRSYDIQHFLGFGQRGLQEVTHSRYMCASTQEHHALPTVPHGVPFDGLQLVKNEEFWEVSLSSRSSFPPWHVYVVGETPDSPQGLLCLRTSSRKSSVESRFSPLVHM